MYMYACVFIHIYKIFLYDTCFHVYIYTYLHIHTPRMYVNKQINLYVYLYIYLYADGCMKPAASSATAATCLLLSPEQHHVSHGITELHHCFYGKLRAEGSRLGVIWIKLVCSFEGFTGFGF